METAFFYRWWKQQSAAMQQTVRQLVNEGAWLAQVVEFYSDILGEDFLLSPCRPAGVCKWRLVYE